MLDGMVGAIRSGLDAAASPRAHPQLCANTVRFYGPFRDAAESPPNSATGRATR